MKILNFLQPKFKRDKEINKSIYFFFTGYQDPDVDYNNVYAISEILTKRTKKELVIEITTSKPGILIGKGGEKINSLEFHLYQEFNLAVNVKIKECNIWLFNKY